MIKFEPLPDGLEFVVLDLDRDITMIFHDKYLEMENQWAKESCEAPTLESNERDSLNEHGNFTLEMPQKSCSFKATPELGMLSAPRTHEKCNHPKAFSCKIFRRVVVDAFVYRKHYRFCGCTVALTL